MQLFIVSNESTMCVGILYKLFVPYLTSTGPLSKTVVDFWRMVWQEHVHTVVMVTNIKENNKAKCHQYWPNTEDTVSFGPFTVTLSEQQMFADYTIRLLQLQV